MTNSKQDKVTNLWMAWSEDKPEALEELMPLIYAGLGGKEQTFN